MNDPLKVTFEIPECSKEVQCMALLEKVIREFDLSHAERMRVGTWFNDFIFSEDADQ